MPPPPAICHAAVRSRDRRFDGVFFTGVTSTSIYCRPVCPTRAPKLANCDFFDTAAAAADAGFRPCLRCRPELAPAMHLTGADALPAQLLRFLQTKALEGLDVPAIAEASGYSERQFRRLIGEAYGVSPVAMVQNERLLFAKRLLHDTELPVSEIALTAGFQSVRRFNQVFSERLRLTPTQVRNQNSNRTEAGVLRLQLSYRPPFAWEDMLHWLAVRATRGVEAVSLPEGRYARTVCLGPHRGWLSVLDNPDRCALQVELSPSLAPALPAVQERLRALFDLDANPDLMQRVFARDALLGPLAQRHPGLRVPGAWDIFESAVRVILGQQVTVVAASTISARLVKALGEPITTPQAELTHLNVTPRALANASVGDIATLGMPGKRAETLRMIGAHAERGGLIFPPTMSFDDISAQLTALPGIGTWTAHYLAMRALRFPDAFPAGDLGLRKALGHGTAIPEREADALSQQWRPWRAYAAALLWRSLGND